METITDYLQLHAEKCPGKKVYVYLENGETESASLTFAELHRTVSLLSSTIGKYTGSRAVLLYENPIAFIAAFMACQYAGVTAVPMFFPKGKRHFERLELVLKDSGSRVVLCEQEQYEKIAEGFGQAGFASMPIVPAGFITGTEEVSPEQAYKVNALSFIQYTSGSTGDPKGVMVSHENLLHNQSLIGGTFQCDKDSVILSWLPFYHDMGLVGNLLHAVFTGCTAVLMSPYAFMQSPVRWFKAIDTYKVTHSGGPNFAYDLCVDKIKKEELETIDLSSWKVAYNGSEPVSNTTIQRFTDTFSVCGFSASAMFPCYGLAEATLLVSGSPHSDSAAPIACSGAIAAGMEVLLFDQATQKPCPEEQEGEICLHGKSITAGYWGKDNQGLFIRHDDKDYLKTGDLGILRSGMLYITGRIREMIIINGQNHFPYDIERTVFKTFSQIEPNGVIVFAAPQPVDGIVIAAELKREFVNDESMNNVLRNVFLEVVSSHTLSPFDVVFVKPRYLPRTSSGKLQRLKCREDYMTGQMDICFSLRTAIQSGESSKGIIDPAFFEKIKTGLHPELVHQYLAGLIADKVGFRLPDMAKQPDIELTEIGVDSIKAMEIINAVNKDLSINLVAAAVFQENRYASLVEHIENSLWLKSNKTGEEIVI